VSTDADRRRESRERYQAVLATVAHQTTPRQPPGVRPVHLRLHQATHGPHDADDVDSAIRAALENDDLLRWRDADGEIRLTLRTEPDLKHLAQYVAEELQDPDQLAHVNTALLEVRNDE
jgi:hypothetical protein